MNRNEHTSKTIYNTRYPLYFMCLMFLGMTANIETPIMIETVLLMVGGFIIITEYLILTKLSERDIDWS